jgi:hypothetical protein
MNNINAALVPSRHLHRRLHKDLRSIGKGLSSIQAFLDHRQTQWKKSPDLQAKHQHSFENYLAAELAECVANEKQKNIY